MADNKVVPFSRPTTHVQEVLQSPHAKPDRQMVRVIDIESPFFSWEGWIYNVLAQGEEEKKYVQIICAHSGFQFPALTFSTDQLARVEIQDEKS